MDPDEVQLPDKHVCRDTTSRFAANSCSCAFQSVSSSVENPPLVRTLRGDGQKSREDGHTAGTHGWGKGHLQTTQKDDTKQVRINCGQAASGTGQQRQPSTRTPMRPHQSYSRGGPVPRETLLRVATPVVQVQTPQVGLVEDVRQPSLLSMMGVRTP